MIGHAAALRPASWLAFSILLGSSVGESFPAGAQVPVADGGRSSVSAGTAGGEVPRVLQVRTEPESPVFGEPFELHVTLRIAKGTTVVPPDTLGRAEFVWGAGPGRWRATAARADSMDVFAVYPLLAFRPGVSLLPAFEVGVLAASGTGDPTVRSTADPAAAGAVRVPILLDPAAVRVAEFSGFADLPEDSVLRPRPAADVIGGDWSVWGVLALALTGLAGVGGAGTLLARLWTRVMGGVGRPGSPRAHALTQLDRVRAEGWHRNGRVDDFYAASTDAAREFVTHLEPLWTRSLTSTELIAKLQERAGASRAEHLALVFDRAERVKFGRLRPSADEAEEDWLAIRDWVREVR